LAGGISAVEFGGTLTHFPPELNISIYKNLRDLIKVLIKNDNDIPFIILFLPYDDCPLP